MATHSTGIESTPLPHLSRAESDTSEWTDKGYSKNTEDIEGIEARRPEAISEEDETNVGLAAYNESKNMAEIVSVALLAGVDSKKGRQILTALDTGAKQPNPKANRHVLASSLPHHPDIAVPRQDCPQLRKGLW